MLSERIFFIMEGFSDIYNLMMDLDFDVKNVILNLRRELSRVHEYLTLFDAKDEEPSLSEQMLFSSIAAASDDILYDLTRKVHSTDLVGEIRNLVERIQKYSFQQVSSQLIVTINASGNINNGDRQEIASTSVFLSPNTPLKIKKDVRPKSHDHDPSPDIVGFKHEIETLVNHLLRNDKSRAVGIVGMGGSGKTTLAKLIYHQSQIKHHFDLKVWVCVSQSWNKRDILCEMLRQAKNISINHSKQMSEVEIHEDLFKLLTSLSYLVVLDDIWDMNVWIQISSTLPTSERSKVIVTTRNTSICKTIHPVLILKPEPLNATESYELFQKLTFLDEKSSHMLVKLGEEMVNRCRGLPLSITALAGILRMDKSESRWRRISETLMQKILNTDSSQGVVKEVLEMSYCDLPHYLKSCFLYLGIFPEDYIVKTEELIQMWIAECLIRSPQDDKESIAEDYLEEMVQRCIIQDVQVNEIGQVTSFRIHDLIREMCVDVAEKKGFLKDSHRIWSNITGVLDSEKTSHVRSFIFFKNSSGRFLTINLHGLLQKFMVLRVLIIGSLSFVADVEEVVPEEIGNLIHLRYLEFYGWFEIKLPSTFENLQNLWTLKLNESSKFILMPKIFLKMKDLKHLYLPTSYEIEGERCGVMNLERLQKLKTLSNVRGGDWLFLEMSSLSCPLQELGIKNIKSKEQLKAVLSSLSILPHSLQTLALNWFDGAQKKIEDDDMNNIHKCESLRSLFLTGEIGVSNKSRSLTFPPNLVKLTLVLTLLKDVDVMGIIDKCCPQLKFLILGEDAYVGSDLICNANCFQQLETLHLDGYKLKRWTIERGAMSNLNLLFFTNCYNLKLYPQGWEFVSNLPQVICDNYSLRKSQFEEKLKSMRGEKKKKKKKTR